MNGSVLLKRGLFLLTAFLGFVLVDVSISASEKNPAILKSPTVEKKQQPEAGDKKLPEIFLETTEYASGEVYEGTTVSHDFIVKNKGEDNLLIKSVRPG